MPLPQDLPEMISAIYDSLGLWKSMLLRTLSAINRRNTFYVCSIILQFQSISDSASDFWTTSNPLGNWTQDRHPLYVVKPRDTLDVSNAVRCALISGLRVTPGTIRQSADMFGLGVDNTSVVIDMTGMEGVIGIDKKKGTASMLPGTLIGSLQEELASKSGMWSSVGLLPTVGVADSLIGGGRNLWSNLIGAASDQLIAAKVVLFDGSEVKASYDENPELLWALRGGGEGNFGVISEMTIAIYKNPARIRTLKYVWGSKDMPKLFCHFTQLMNSQRNKMTSLNDTEAMYWRSRNVRLGVTQHNLTAIVSIYEPFEIRRKMSIQEDERIASLNLDSLPEPISFEAFDDFEMPNATARLTFQEEWNLLAGNSTPIIKEKNVLLPQGANIPSFYCILFAKQMWQSDERVDRCEIDFYGGTINEFPPTAASFVHRKTGINLNFRSIVNSPLAPTKGIPWSVNSWTNFQSIALHEAYRSPIDLDLEVSVDWAHLYYAQNLLNLLIIREYYDPFRLFDFPQGLSRLKIVTA